MSKLEEDVKNYYTKNGKFEKILLDKEILFSTETKFDKGDRSKKMKEYCDRLFQNKMKNFGKAAYFWLSEGVHTPPYLVMNFKKYPSVKPDHQLSAEDLFPLLYALHMILISSDWIIKKICHFFPYDKNFSNFLSKIENKLKNTLSILSFTS